MMSGYYVLDVSCDCPECVVSPDAPERKQYHGANRGDCVRQARLDGWSFLRDGRCIFGKHVRVPKKKPASSTSAKKGLQRLKRKR